MNSENLPESSLIAAAFAVLFLLVMDAAITRTDLLWGPTAFEDTRGNLRVFPQAYRVARRIYARRTPDALHVVLLGNSRVALGAREQTVVDALSAQDPSRDFRVDNLALFGAGPVTTNLVWRHLRPDPPDLTVLTIGPTDLLTPTSGGAADILGELFAIGWSDPAGDPTASQRRLDRWLRTIWPLYRFREYARAVLGDRLNGRPAAPDFPDRFKSRREFFEWLRPLDAAAMDRRFRQWQADPGLENFLHFLESTASDPLRGLRNRTRRGVDLETERRNLAAVDGLLSDLARARAGALLLVMPESPLMAQDGAGLYHIPGYSDRGVAALHELSRVHGIAFVDGRGWLPADSFFDLDHPMPDLSGFEALIAREILSALDARSDSG